MRRGGGVTKQDGPDDLKTPTVRVTWYGKRVFTDVFKDLEMGDLFWIILINLV